MKKRFAILFSLFSFLMFAPSVFAQGTILPKGTETDTVADCNELLDQYVIYGTESLEEGISTEQISINEILSCAIKTGRVELWMIPHFVLFIIETLLGVAGLIAVLFLVVAGYQYIFGGLTEDKDKAKKTITYAISGLIVALLAWALVNLLQLALTS